MSDPSVSSFSEADLALNVVLSQLALGRRVLYLDGDLERARQLQPLAKWLAVVGETGQGEAGFTWLTPAQVTELEAGAVDLWIAADPDPALVAGLQAQLPRVLEPRGVAVLGGPADGEPPPLPQDFGASQWFMQRAHAGFEALPHGPDQAQREARHWLAVCARKQLPQALGALSEGASSLIQGAALRGLRQSLAQTEACWTSEQQRLEELLRHNARALRDAQQRLRHVEAVARDLGRRMRAPEPSTSGSVDPVVQERLQAAQQRALEAEARHAEVAFRLDEVMGHLAVARGELPAEPQPDPDHVHAHLAGTTRGLQAALAESEEQREVLAARSMLLEEDLQDARALARSIEREWADERDTFELELVSLRARTQGRPTVAQVASLQGERNGALLRLDEAEQAFAHAQVLLARAKADRAQAQRAAGEARAEASELRAANGGLSARLLQAESRLEQDDDSVASLRGELQRRVSSTADLETELARCRRDLAELKQAAEAQQVDLAQQREKGEATVTSLRAKSDRAIADAATLEHTLRETRRGLAHLNTRLTGLFDEASSSALAPSEMATEELGEPTAPGEPVALAQTMVLEQQLQARDARILELEAELGRAAAGRAVALEGLQGDLDSARQQGDTLTRELERERAHRRAVGAAARALQSALPAGDGAAQARMDELVRLLDGPF